MSKYPLMLKYPTEDDDTTIGEQIYLLLEELEIETDEVIPYLNSIGKPSLSVCPRCHVDDFTHVEGCEFNRFVKEHESDRFENDIIENTLAFQNIPEEENSNDKILFILDQADQGHFLIKRGTDVYTAGYNKQRVLNLIELLNGGHRPNVTQSEEHIIWVCWNNHEKAEKCDYNEYNFKVHFDLYESLYGEFVKMDDRFESIHVWNKQLAIQNAGRWTPKVITKEQFFKEFGDNQHKQS